MQARQQEQRRELQQAKRRTLIIRYDFIIAPLLLIGLVVFFVLMHQTLDAVISGALVVILAIALLAFATLMPTRNTSRPARSSTPEPPDGPASASAQPSEDQAEDQAASGNQG